LWLAFSLSLSPQSSLVVRAGKSSESDRKIFVRNVCSSVRHDSPGSADFNELMFCVPMIGMHLGNRESHRSRHDLDNTDLISDVELGPAN
jgi:hypothetical protein